MSNVPAVRPTVSVRRPRGRPKKLENLTVDQLVDQGQQLLAAIAEVEAGPTDGYRYLADLILQLRMRFQSPKNPKLPDWRGSSAEYREAASRIYADVQIPPDSVDSMQSRIRYHVGNRLREVAPPRELKALGLSPVGGKAKAATRRAQQKAIERPAGVTTRADLFREAKRVIEMVVFQLPMPDTGSPEYVEMMSELTELTKLGAQLWAMHERRRSDERNRIELLQTYQRTRLQLPDVGENLDALKTIRQEISIEARQIGQSAIPSGPQPKRRRRAAA